MALRGILLFEERRASLPLLLSWALSRALASRDPRRPRDLALYSSRFELITYCVSPSLNQLARLERQFSRLLIIKISNLRSFTHAQISGGARTNLHPINAHSICTNPRATVVVSHVGRFPPEQVRRSNPASSSLPSANVPTVRR